MCQRWGDLRDHVAIEDNYIPIEQLTFQSAAAHLPASLGRAALKIATLQTGRHHIVLIPVDPPICVSCAMLARNGGFVDRLDNTSSVNIIHYSLQWWGRIGRSISTDIGHWAKQIATHFEVPGIYDSMFVFCWPRLASDCAGYYSEECDNGLFILYRNQARFAFVFPFVSLHAWRYCSIFLSSYVALHCVAYTSSMFGMYK